MAMGSDEQNDQVPSNVDLFSQLSRIYLFKEVDEQLLRCFAPELKECSVAANEYIFHQGDKSDGLYLITEGSLSLLVDRKDGSHDVVCEESVGGVIGEVGLFTGEPRIHAARAKTEVTLVCVPKEIFRSIVSRDPVAYKQIGKAIQEQLRRNRLREIMPKLFGDGLTEDEIAHIESFGRWVYIAGGDFLMRQGDDGSSMYIVVSGRLQALLAKADGGEHVLGEIVPGETVGEMALFSSEPRSVDVRASRDSYVVEFSKEAFEELSEKYKRFMMGVCQLVIRRLRNAQEPGQKKNDGSTVALVNLTDKVPLGEFAARVTEGVAISDTALHLSKEKTEQLLGVEGIAGTAPGDPLDVRLQTWMDDQESRNDFVLYECDNSDMEWTSRCIRRADCILLIGHVSANPAVEPFEYRICNLSTAPKDLIVVHPDGSNPPSNTIEWLDQRNLRRHHHIRWNIDDDFMRLARFLTARAVGLVIAGGGIKAAAGIGAYRAIQQAGITIDAIGGTSGGSVASVGIALGWETTKCLEFLTNAMKLFFKGLTLPLLSIAKGKRVTALFREMIGDTNAEDTWIPFFCVASNLSRGDMKVLDRGPLYRLIRTSGSLPGLLPPMVWDGDLHVDGAIVSNNPVETMSAIVDGGRVISIDLFSMKQFGGNADLPDNVGGLSLLWSTLLNKLSNSGSAKTIPTFPGIMQRCIEITTVRQDESAAKLADVHVKAPLDDYIGFEWKQAKKIEELGYESTKESLKDWISDERRA